MFGGITDSLFALPAGTSGDLRAVDHDALGMSLRQYGFPGPRSLGITVRAERNLPGRP